MKKLFIKNRHNRSLAVVVDEHPSQRGIAFVLYGMGGYKEQPHIVAFHEALYEAGYTTIRYDASNTIGEWVGDL